MKRPFDIVFSFFALLILSPFIFLYCIWILFDSRGGIFFGQTRVGLNGKTFTLWKLRTMKPMSESKGQLTIGSMDSRITRSGKFLRKYKLDELPQMWNVLLGAMSIVGPRPEVPRYVALYNDVQKKVLEVKPGITDFASLEYFEESDLLAKSDNPEHTYIISIMPAKLELNLRYIREQSFATDMKIIGQTVKRILNS